MATDLKPIPISSLPSADLESTDQIVAYRDTDGNAYRSVVGQIGSTNLSDAFDTSKSYSAGDYCIYSNTLYKFTSDHSGRWTGDDVEATLVGTELTELNTNLDKRLTVDDFLIASTTSASFTLASSSSTSTTIDVSRAGYTPIFAAQSNASVARLTCYGVGLTDTTVTCRVVNLGTSSATGTVTVMVLYVRN